MVASPEWQALIKQGTLLSSYYGVTHPSEPNYLAMVAGDFFGVQDDWQGVFYNQTIKASQGKDPAWGAYNFPASILTIVDLLERKGLTWGMYNQFAGFQACTQYTTGATM